MLQGAIIGLVVGLVMVAVRLYQQRKGGAKVMEAIRAGGPEARTALDSYVKPIYGKVSAQKLINQLERYAWLAILGDFEALEAEAQAAEGMLNVVTQLRVQAYAGLLAHRTEARDLEAMEAVATRIQTEGGALSGLVKKIATDAQMVARGVAGQGVDPAVLDKVAKRAAQSGPATKAVLYRFLARACQANGMDSSGYEAEARKTLDHLI
jgi:hypothetical protein